MKLHIYHEDRPWNCEACFWLVAEMPDGTRKIAKPIEFVFESDEKNDPYKEPTMRFHGYMAMEFFPALQEAMIRSGFLKPKKDESIEAMQNHLNDMRRLVFERNQK